MQITFPEGQVSTCLNSSPWVRRSPELSGHRYPSSGSARYGQFDLPQADAALAMPCCSPRRILASLQDVCHVGGGTGGYADRHDLHWARLWCAADRFAGCLVRSLAPASGLSNEVRPSTHLRASPFTAARLAARPHSEPGFQVFQRWRARSSADVRLEAECFTRMLLAARQSTS